ncbi:MAG TPA: pilus assembly PilX N-terminal domain-containing protein [Gemmatimonadaceae bacterium]
MQNRDESVTTPNATETANRKGVALITALFGVVVLAVMMSGMYFTSNQEYRGTRNALVEQRAFAIAEYGLNSEISNWDRSRNVLNTFPIGSIDSNQVYVAVGDTAWVKVSRLTDNTFWVVSEGLANMGRVTLESRRLTSAFVRIAYPTIEPKGAITAAGNVRLQGAANVDGDDLHPAGWTNCDATLAPTVPAVTVPPAGTVTTGPGNITSSPAVAHDSAAADSNTYVRYGSESWNSLSSNADIKLPGGVFNADILPVGTPTTCDQSVTSNWGEPQRPGTVIGCYGYFPIIYSAGDLHINGNGRGQGILLVNGDLSINGIFDFYGIVIARDDILKSNGTARIYGAVFAANLTAGDVLSWMTGDQDVQYSNCAVQSALKGSAILVRVKERHWAQVF